MNTEDHATPPPLFPVVSDDDSDDDSICVPKFSEKEQHGNDGPPASLIPPELPPQKSSQEDTELAHSEEAPEGATPGCPIREYDKNRLRRANLHKIIYALNCGRHQKPVHVKNLSKKRQGLKYKK